jgi:hypothetical protein
MSKIQPTTTDQRMYAAAENAFVSEGGGPMPTPTSQRERDMKEFSIRRDGLRYEFRGHHYDLLSDAIGYARLLRAQSQLQQGLVPTETAGPVAPAAEDSARTDPALPTQ